MSGDRVNSGGKKGSLSVGGHRKRGRTTPTSAGSDSRIRLAPRDPFRRHLRGSSSSSSSSAEQNRSTRTIAQNLDTPPFRRAHVGSGSSGSGGPMSLVSNDDYLDDVRFDIEPKDMCLPLGSQDTPKLRTGEQTETVVLEELCSLGSVLAGAFCKDVIGNTAVDENNPKQNDDGGGDGNNSRGPKDSGAPGGENLLTRWLSSSGNSNPGVAGDAPSREIGDVVGRSLGREADVPGRASVAGVASTAGSRVVGNWAKKALRRKKLADAERGRRMRLQLEDEALAATTAAELSNASNASETNTDDCNSRGGGDWVGCPSVPRNIADLDGKSIAPTENGTNALRMKHPNVDERVKDNAIGPPLRSQDDVQSNLTTALKSREPGGDDSGIIDAVKDTKGDKTALGSTANTSGKEIVVADDDDDDGDEYGDDFGFLTDADLQAMEEQAAQASASASQSASQSASTFTNRATAGDNNVPLNPFPAAGTQTVHKRGANSVTTRGTRDVSVMDGTGNVHVNNAEVINSSVGDLSRMPQSTTVSNFAENTRQLAGSKRPAGFSTRPPLATIGPNAKRADHRQHHQCGGDQSAESEEPWKNDITKHNPAVGGIGGSQGHRGSRDFSHGDAVRSGVSGCSQGKSVSGRGQGARGAGDRSRRQGLSGVEVIDMTFSKPNTAQHGAASSHTPGVNKRHRVARGDDSDGRLFTTYGSVEEFARATGSGRAKSPGTGKTGQPEKGQTRLTDFGRQQQQQHGSSSNQQSRSNQAGFPKQGGEQASPGTQGDMPSVVGNGDGQSATFVPALVHRRFLVLEVTYVSAQNNGGHGHNGVGVREKILMALEQHPRETTTEDANTSSSDDDTSAGEAGAGQEEGTFVARQTKISLQGDWYDCEVEPGEVVHIIFPLGVHSMDGRATTITEAENEPLESEHIIVDNGSGKLLIVHPDILVSPTKVAETVICNRKAVLQSRLASNASKSKPAVLGNLKHELFEMSLLAAAASAKDLASARQTPTTATAIVDSSARDSDAGRQSPASIAAYSWQYQSQRQRQDATSASSGQRDAGVLSSKYMRRLVDKIVVSQLEALYGAGLDEDTARRELLAVSGPILAWHRSFLSIAAPRPSPSHPNPKHAHNRGFQTQNNNGSNFRGGGARLHQGKGAGREKGSTAGGFASSGPDGTPSARINVRRVLCIEDDVWTPVLGMKGIMDATVEATVEMMAKGGYGQNGGWGREGCSLVMPVEVKTGKRIGDAHSSHRAQVMLYTLVLRVRYGQDASTSGLLVYTSHDSLHTELVSPVPAEIRALILARNRHATGMAKIGRVGLVGGGRDQIDGRVGGGQAGGASLPPVIRRPRECGMCFQNSECMLYHRAAEGGDEGSAGIEKGVFDKKVGHLSGAHLAFFSHWDRAIDLEGKIGEQVRSTMWQESGQERESRTSKCMSRLVWLGESEDNQSSAMPTSSRSTVHISDNNHNNKSSENRRKKRVSFANGTPKSNIDTDQYGGKRFKHVFTRAWAVPETVLMGAAGDTPQCERPKWAKPLKDLSLSVGDMVCVSAEAHPWKKRRSARRGSSMGNAIINRAGVNHVRLLTGNVFAIFEDTVEVVSDKRMRVPTRGSRLRGQNRNRATRSGSNDGVRATGSEAGEALDIEDLIGGRTGDSFGGCGQETAMFRVDKDEWAAGINMMRSNLVRLMSGPSPECEAAGDTKDGGDNMGDDKRRRLIVDLEPPRFGRFTGLLDVPGTLIGWAGDRYAGSRAAGGEASAANRPPHPSNNTRPARNAAPPGKASLSGNSPLAGIHPPVPKMLLNAQRGSAQAPHRSSAGCKAEAGRVGGTGKIDAGGVRTGQELEEMFRNGLNEDQRSAVRKLVTAKDYTLLLGMPGTGKTWTIAFAVRVLLARGASVLITSYTHSAVDNLLLKLIEEGVPCLRVGKPGSVHPGVQSCCINYDGTAETTAAYSELVASARVVGCTCLGVKHPLFSQRRFDYCVVDEAGQISQPVVLAPLRCADVFVLVGDHYQLPPLVTSEEASDAGMSESLFRRLCEAHPESLQRLSYQYRMNGDVMTLCNDLTYSGQLRCGNAKVEDQRLYLPNPTAIPQPSDSSTLSASTNNNHHLQQYQGSSGNMKSGVTPSGRNHTITAPSSAAQWQGKTPPPHLQNPHRQSAMTPWLSQVLQPEKRVVFLDTDAVSPGDGELTSEARGGGSLNWGGAGYRPFSGLEFRAATGDQGEGGGRKGSLVNGVECDVVRLLAWGLDAAGFDLDRAGVISPYRSQVQLLQSEVQSVYPRLEINTIDKYQGRDKEVIVVSFVRSNAEGTVGYLLRDWRRLNVALSRAKRKLIMIGSLRTLSSCAVLSSLMGILQERGWVYRLPPGAHRAYPLGVTSASKTSSRDIAEERGVRVLGEEEGGITGTTGTRTGKAWGGAPPSGGSDLNRESVLTTSEASKREVEGGDPMTTEVLLSGGCGVDVEGGRGGGRVKQGSERFEGVVVPSKRRSAD